MATQQDIDSIVSVYVKLLIAQYSKEKAIQYVKNVLEISCLDGIFLDLETAFDIDIAIGKQLDILASTEGIDRNYSGGLLTDEEFRVVLKFQIMKNKSNHSLYEIDKLIHDFFNGDVKVFSNQEMEIHYVVKTEVSNILQKVIEKKALPRPIGNSLNVISADSEFFCFADTNTTIEEMAKIKGFNSDGIFLDNHNFL